MQGPISPNATPEEIAAWVANFKMVGPRVPTNGSGGAFSADGGALVGPRSEVEVPTNLNGMVGPSAPMVGPTKSRHGKHAGTRIKFTATSEEAAFIEKEAKGRPLTSVLHQALKEMMRKRVEF
jgi:hypothetical protein